MLHVYQRASLSASRALSGGNAHRRGGSCLELKELSYISIYDDRCGVFGPPETVQYSVCAVAFAAFARDYCDDFIFLLLASQAPKWKTCYKICAVRGTLQEPRWSPNASFSIRGFQAQSTSLKKERTCPGDGGKA
ncbi:hypothetical protein ATANTOWER_028954 [Ataeniobius toweri]|uniref:Uncharacterized protein n=1 Tax=Ataeniobius toweri TaxID=208326 RepID=A0ABU7BSP0_9TELE|nr:hypothetical protein [Ataeniobius toweri]